MNVLSLRLPTNSDSTPRCHPWRGISGTQILNGELENYHSLGGNHSKTPNGKMGVFELGEGATFKILEAFFRSFSPAWK